MIVYELQEFFVVSEIHDHPQTRINEDYNEARWKPDPEKGYVNIEFQYYQQCVDYILNCDKKDVVFQINKLYRRVESKNEAYIAIVKSKSETKVSA